MATMQVLTTVNPPAPPPPPKKEKNSQNYKKLTKQGPALNDKIYCQHFCDEAKIFVTKHSVI